MGVIAQHCLITIPKGRVHHRVALHVKAHSCFESSLLAKKVTLAAKFSLCCPCIYMVMYGVVAFLMGKLNSVLSVHVCTAM